MLGGFKDLISKIPSFQDRLASSPPPRHPHPLLNSNAAEN